MGHTIVFKVRSSRQRLSLRRTAASKMVRGDAHLGGEVVLVELAS